jgi:hypothetical protein
MDDVKVKKPRKADKRTREREPFSGFPQEIRQTDFSILPNVWINVCAAIENLAELKVVLYIMRHTWGFNNYDSFVRITIDEFMNGRKRSDGSRMDMGTQLSKVAVVNGLALAEKDGFIVSELDESDKARKKKSYKLNMLPAQEQEDEGQSDVKIVYTDGKDCLHQDTQSLQRSDNEFEEITYEENCNSNYPSTEKNLEAIRSIPSPRTGPRGANVIRQQVEDFSSDLGDAEHIASNVVQAYKIHHDSGLDEETFIDLMYEARERARKASIKKVNAHGRPNRMPYFFRCLKQLAQGGHYESNRDAL